MMASACDFSVSDNYVSLSTLLDHDQSTAFGEMVIGQDVTLSEVTEVIQDSTSCVVLHKKWKQFARVLEISEIEILKLEKLYENNHIYELFYGIVLAWQAQLGKRAFMRVFVESLVACGVKDIADSLEANFGQNGEIPCNGKRDSKKEEEYKVPKIRSSIEVWDDTVGNDANHRKYSVLTGDNQPTTTCFQSQKPYLAIAAIIVAILLLLVIAVPTLIVVHMNKTIIPADNNEYSKNGSGVYQQPTSATATIVELTPNLPTSSNFIRTINASKSQKSYAPSKTEGTTNAPPTTLTKVQTMHKPATVIEVEKRQTPATHVSIALIGPCSSIGFTCPSGNGYACWQDNEAFRNAEVGKRGGAWTHTWRFPHYWGHCYCVGTKNFCG